MRAKVLQIDQLAWISFASCSDDMRGDIEDLAERQAKE